MIAEMTIEEKVGQLIMVGFEGTQANEAIETHIRERFVGGVVLFSRNIQSPKQTAELTNELQRLAVRRRIKSRCSSGSIRKAVGSFA